MQKMKLVGASIIGLLLVTVAQGATLDQRHVAADAKWIFHADLDELRASKVGSAVFKLLQAGPLKEANLKLAAKLGIELDFAKIHAITAYGSDFETEPDNNGVIMIQAGQDLSSALEALLKQPKDEVKVAKVTRDGLSLYSVNDEFHVTQLAGNVLVVSKAAESIVNARNVISGKAANLATGKGFTGYSANLKPVFLIQAEGFNKQEKIPQAAQFLKSSDGLRLAIGETENNIQVALDLKAPNKETSNQLSQAVNGMIALFRLNQGNPGLTQLLNATQVKTSDNLVSVNLSFPIDQALKQLSERNP